ncbi:MAG: hypothetical protein ETSY2_52645 [Candidatus Entotheonella gemina]|uniref:Uncharacterized protein n=1 Tax=Candidatus Entotheonella gemina TaxID=1429439 RepID=W4L609_9BACT|nr:MAG: hypothetical protein ETSY2_52645 [Candidatus Entotheonella gemina]
MGHTELIARVKEVAQHIRKQGVKADESTPHPLDG